MSKSDQKRHKCCCRTTSGDKSKLYKTEPCDKGWNNPDNCPYGNRCQYAHSKEELRARKHCRHWRTESCRNYERDGHCPYGSRCRFIHIEADVENLPRIPVGRKVSKLEAEIILTAWTARILGDLPPPAVHLKRSRLMTVWAE